MIGFVVKHMFIKNSQYFKLPFKMMSTKVLSGVHNERVLWKHFGKLCLSVRALLVSDFRHRLLLLLLLLNMLSLSKYPIRPLPSLGGGGGGGGSGA